MNFSKNFFGGFHTIHSFFGISVMQPAPSRFGPQVRKPMLTFISSWMKRHDFWIEVIRSFPIQPRTTENGCPKKVVVFLEKCKVKSSPKYRIKDRAYRFIFEPNLKIEGKSNDRHVCVGSEGMTTSTLCTCVIHKRCAVIV
jgi:hypothetical protein